ncbi:MAG: hypothetical protein HZA89_05470 [Verrucomicrobia bacterium]|nr:hypothetical protein [Verrucomicrobiota bacterium]
MSATHHPPDTVVGDAASNHSRLISDLPWVLSLFLVALGAKLWLIQLFGSPLMLWDQWMDAYSTFIPYAEGRLTLADLLSPHSESPYFFHRLTSLGLLLLNGQWENYPQVIVNAFLHAGGAAAFGWLMARLIGRRDWPWVMMPLALALVLPFAWENTLAGFQTPFYFMLLFSLLAIWLLGLHPAGTPQWWGGWGCAFCAVLNLGAGVLAPVAVIALVMTKIILRREDWRRHLPTLCVCVAIVVIWLPLRVEQPAHQVLKAHSLMEFLISLGKNLAWPWIVLPPYAVVNFFPFGLLVWHYCRSKEKENDRRAEEMIIGVGLWVLLQAGATAYARGGGGAHPQWRYMDSTVFAMIVNGFSILILAKRHTATNSWRRITHWGFGLWIIATTSGLILLNARAWTVDIPERQFNQEMQIKNARYLMATDDYRGLETARREHLPFFGDAWLVPGASLSKPMAELFHEPHVRAWLPACIREPLKVVPSANDDGAFVARGVQLAQREAPTEFSWGSYSTTGAAAKGVFESQPVRRSGLPYLEIPVAGQLGRPGLSLELVDLTTQRRIPVIPAKPPGAAWQNVYVKAPPGEFKIVARDDSETGWLAFKEPREMGRCSRLALRLLAAGRWLFFAGCGLFLFCFVRRFQNRGADVPG